MLIEGGDTESDGFPHGVPEQRHCFRRDGISFSLSPLSPLSTDAHRHAEGGQKGRRRNLGYQSAMTSRRSPNVKQGGLGDQGNKTSIHPSIHHPVIPHDRYSVRQCMTSQQRSRFGGDEEGLVLQPLHLPPDLWPTTAQW